MATRAESRKGASAGVRYRMKDAVEVRAWSPTSMAVMPSAAAGARLASRSSKKAQTAGYYYGDALLRPNKPYRQFNTWMGDPARAILFRTIVDEVERLGLVESTARVGGYLYGKLEGLAGRYPGQFENLRGKGMGTFIAFDHPKRDVFLAEAKKVGINIGGSGQSAVRLRPMLIFQEKHADLLVEGLEKVAKTLA